VLYYTIWQHCSPAPIRGVQDPDFRTESGEIQHIFNGPDGIRTTVLFKFPDQDQEFQISLFWDLTPTQS